MATYAIGDIQGCYAQLQELLSLIAPSASDTIWFTGDLVNRGPNSVDSLRLIRSLGSQAITVLGNHDLHLLAVAAKTQPIKPKDTFQDVLTAKDAPELLNWLQQLPLIHYDHHLNFLLVHAGILPHWSLTQAQQYGKEVTNILQSDQAKEFFLNMYGEKPQAWSEDLSGWDRLRFITNVFTRMRFCTLEAHLEFHHKQKKHAAPEHFIPWFEHPAHNNIPYQIIFGHWAALEGKTHHPKIHALDTGCVWGNSLTAMRLEDGQYFSVPGYKEE